MPNIAIYSQKNGDEIQAYLHQFILELEKRENVQIFLHEKILEKNSLLGNYQIFSDKNSLEKCEIDYFFSFGGDGTILSALTLIQDLEIPVVGVNMGRLGFLANFSKEEIFDNIDKIFAREMHISQRSVIEVKTAENRIDFPYALNDVVITRQETTSMITVEAEINGKFLSMFWGDGLIVATAGLL